MIQDSLPSERMKDCRCRKGKAVFYCNLKIKCHDQEFYCLLCTEKHDHKPVTNAIIYSQVKAKWTKLTDQLIDIHMVALQKYNNIKDVIEIATEILKENYPYALQMQQLESLKNEINTSSKQIEEYFEQYEMKEIINIEKQIDTFQTSLDKLKSLKDIESQAIMAKLVQTDLTKYYDRFNSSTLIQISKIKQSQFQVAIAKQTNKSNKDLISINQEQFALLNAQVESLHQQMVLGSNISVYQMRESQQLCVEQIRHFGKQIEAVHSENQQQNTILQQQIIDLQQLRNDQTIQRQEDQNKIQKLEQEVSLLKNMMISREYLLKMQAIVDQPYSQLKTVRILHITQNDAACPNQISMQQLAEEQNLKLIITEILDIEQNIDLSQFDSILVSIYNGYNRQAFGDFLNKAADQGKTIVQLFWSNYIKYCPLGSFQGPFTPKSYDNQHQGIRVLKPKHQVLKYYTGITPGECTCRAIVSINPVGINEVFLEWTDGVPLAAVRNDLNGLIFSFGFIGGSSGSQDGLKIVISALALTK